MMMIMMMMMMIPITVVVAINDDDDDNDNDDDDDFLLEVIAFIAYAKHLSLGMGNILSSSSSSSLCLYGCMYNENIRSTIL